MKNCFRIFVIFMLFIQKAQAQTYYLMPPRMEMDSLELSGNPARFDDTINSFIPADYQQRIKSKIGKVKSIWVKMQGKTGESILAPKNPQTVAYYFSVNQFGENVLIYEYCHAKDSCPSPIISRTKYIFDDSLNYLNMSEYEYADSTWVFIPSEPSTGFLVAGMLYPRLDLFTSYICPRRKLQNRKKRNGFLITNESKLIPHTVMKD